MLWQIGGGRRRPFDEHAVSIKTSVRGDDAQIRIKVLEIAEYLNRDNAGGNRFIIFNAGDTRTKLSMRIGSAWPAFGD